MQKHILVIDDEASIRQVLQHALRQAGYRVSAAGTAAEALRLAQADPPDLVTADLHLEESDGLVLIDQLKALVPQVPILLLTGVLFDPEVVSESLGNKVAAYLNKTASLQQVTQEIQRLLGGAERGT